MQAEGTLVRRRALQAVAQLAKDGAGLPRSVVIIIVVTAARDSLLSANTRDLLGALAGGWCRGRGR